LAKRRKRRKWSDDEKRMICAQTRLMPKHHNGPEANHALTISTSLTVAALRAKNRPLGLLSQLCWSIAKKWLRSKSFSKVSTNMPKRESHRSGSELFIVDNNADEWKALRYLHDWCQLSNSIDIAMG